VQVRASRGAFRASRVAAFTFCPSSAGHALEIAHGEAREHGGLGGNKVSEGAEGGKTNYTNITFIHVIRESGETQVAFDSKFVLS